MRTTPRPPVMSRAFRLIGCLLIAAIAAGITVVVSAQAPRIVNGQVANQAAGSGLDASVRSLVSSRTEPAWIGYRVPTVESNRVMCCFGGNTVWSNGQVVMSDGQGCCRACRLEPPADGTSMAERSGSSQTTAKVVRLEHSDHMIVLLRVVDRAVERIRVFSEDCELDAGGRSITWLDGVRPADSVALLESLIPTAPTKNDRLMDGAITAIALHADAAADASLERLVASSRPEAVRRKVTFWLGNARGARGLAVLRNILANDPSADVKKDAVFAVSQNREPAATELLFNIARNDPSPRQRGEAIFWLGNKAGAKAAAAITERIDQDPDTEVKKRAVFALSQMPKDEGVPLLINVARTHNNPAVRKQAMFWLGQSKDPRAIDFFAEILK